MKNRLLLTALLTLPLLVGQPSAALAQQPGAAAAVARNMPVDANGAPRELPSNQESGVEIDRFVGYPGNAVTNIFHGLTTRSMLRGGDPYTPGPQGAVLEYRDDLSLATLEPHYESGVIDEPHIYFYYVQDGVGRLDSGPGTKAYDLHKGVGVLLAPNAKHRFINTGDARLSMISLAWTKNQAMTVKQPIKVVDANTVPLSSGRAHWVHSAKAMFGMDDGVNITISPILIPPISYAGPHAHLKGVEEIWVKVGDDTGYAILGSEIRKIVGTGAFLSPPNGVTVHSSMNLTDEPQIWLYLSRRIAGAGPGANATGAIPPK